MLSVVGINGLGRAKRIAARRVQRLRSDSGVAAIEFAFLAPVLILLFAGICEFSLVLSNYLTLAHAVEQGARQLALSRGDSNPMTDAKSELLGAAGNLTQSNINITYTVNGTACNSNPTCSAALQAGVPSTVSATYPCNLVVFGKDYLPGCTLTAATTER